MTAEEAIAEWKRLGNTEATTSTVLAHMSHCNTTYALLVERIAELKASMIRVEERHLAIRRDLQCEIARLSP